MQSASPNWLAWAQEIQGMAQTGLFYSPDQYHTDRYQRLLEIAAEIIHSQTGAPKEPLVAGFLTQTGYATPKVDVRGAVFRDGKILLVRERSDGGWCMPGGWADVGALPSEMVMREVFEESGFEVKPKKIIGVYDANRSGTPLAAYHAYKIVFLCELIGGGARLSSETDGVDFFLGDHLPVLSTARTTHHQITEAFAHSQDPGRAAAFD